MGATTFADIIEAVTTFVGDYQAFIIAGLVVGLAMYLFRRVLKAGR